MPADASFGVRPLNLRFVAFGTPALQPQVLVVELAVVQVVLVHRVHLLVELVQVLVYLGVLGQSRRGAGGARRAAPGAAGRDQEGRRQQRDDDQCHEHRSLSACHAEPSLHGVEVGVEDGATGVWAASAWTSGLMTVWYWCLT